MHEDERELVARVKQSRDMFAFGDLVQMYQGRLYSLIRGVVGVHQESEDLLQETLLRALRSIDQLRDEGRFGPWASRIAVNLAINHKKTEARRRGVPLEEFDGREGELIDSSGPADNDPFGSLQAKEIRSRLARALDKLPQNHQTAFVLFHQNGLAVREISEITGWDEVTVRTYVFRAVRKLRSRLAGYYKGLEE